MAIWNASMDYVGRRRQTDRDADRNAGRGSTAWLWKAKTQRTRRQGHRSVRWEYRQDRVRRVSLFFVPQKPGCCCLAKMQKCVLVWKSTFSEEDIQKTFLHNITKFYVHIWNYIHIYFPKIIASKRVHLVILFTMANVIRQLEIGEIVCTIVLGREKWMKGK